MQRIAILASGTGSNARRMVEHFQDHEEIEVALIASNKKFAGVLQMAAEHDVDTHIITRDSLYESESFLQLLQEKDIDWIVLAGFLWLIPSSLIQAFPDKIVNIHPSLLPQYGGKGMYGMNVHRAVAEAGETHSGMTIHIVNERYDEGAILFQAQTQLAASDTAEDIAAKVLKLEHQYYPSVVEGWINAGLTGS